MYTVQSSLDKDIGSNPFGKELNHSSPCLAIKETFPSQR